MSFAALFLGLLLGLLGWGCLLAAVMAHPDTENPVIRSVPLPILLVDLLISLGILTMVIVIARNWRKVPGIRQLASIGGASLLGAGALVLLALAG